jgi:hypothetical protein
MNKVSTLQIKLQAIVEMLMVLKRVPMAVQQQVKENDCFMISGTEHALT